MGTFDSVDVKSRRHYCVLGKSQENLCEGLSEVH